MKPLLQSLSQNQTITQYLDSIKNMNTSIIEQVIKLDSSIIEDHGVLYNERSFVWSLIHAYKTKNVDGYKKPKYSCFSMNVPQSMKILNQYPILNDLTTLQSISDSLWEIYQLKKAEMSCTLDSKESGIEFVSLPKIMKLLNSKNGAIVESDGLFQLTTNKGWGGVIRGLVSQKVMTQLVYKNKIVRIPYFNHKGRKLYELNKKQVFTIPLWMQKLPKSYLTACGVK